MEAERSEVVYWGRDQGSILVERQISIIFFRLSSSVYFWLFSFNICFSVVVSLFYNCPTHQRHTTQTSEIEIYTNDAFMNIFVRTHKRCGPSMWSQHPGVCFKTIKNIIKYQLPLELSAIALLTTQRR